MFGKNAVVTAKILGAKYGPTIMIAAGVGWIFTGTVEEEAEAPAEEVPFQDE